MAGPECFTYYSPLGRKYEEENYRGYREAGDTVHRTGVGEKTSWDRYQGCLGVICHKAEDVTGGKGGVNIDTRLYD